MPSQHSILDDLLADEPQDVEVFVQLIGDLAEQVKTTMVSQGLTRRALAQRLGKSESEITKWLSGLHNLTLQSVAKLSVALQQDMLVTPARPQGYFGIGASVQNIAGFNARTNVPLAVFATQSDVASQQNFLTVAVQTATGEQQRYYPFAA